MPTDSTPRKRRSPVIDNRWQLMGFNLLVFLGSVCVMTLELTASRLIAKHVGSSLYTWTSVIGVVLAGITLGNFLGGWLADRFSRPRTLAWMFLLSSIACASVLWLDQLVGRMPRPDYFSWPTWVLCVVTLMFITPAVLLGTTSPIVASMALERSTRMGTTVGNVYAWGAFGSIVGTFLTGFYLIDVWGTRSIIGMTAATLALLAAVVAGGRVAFRTAVVLGWMQFLALVWIVASVTSPTAESWAASYARVVNLSSASATESGPVRDWSEFGDRLGEQLHRLGILLRLRDDQPDAYHDESSYSYIQVRDDYVDGTPVRALRLDKLDHSYFDPANPTALHYEYEEIYAAITHRAAPRAPQELTAKLPDFPGREELLARLPETAQFDAASEILTLSSVEPVALRTLRDLSPEAPFWNAIEQLQVESSQTNWGGFSAVELDGLPPGVVLPKEFDYRLRYDPNLQTLSVYETLSHEDRDQLLGLGTQAPWRRVIDNFRKQSAALSTLFIGGGGFIFPRWILAEFPAAARVDVAELDPAVYRAVQQEMGLTAADDERIHTVIGDARNFVDDRVRANVRAQSTGQAPVVYDFIYGDAFNDFSVPWHLTTQEFTQKVHDLLTPQGVFLANIIEIYPRTELPGGTVLEVVVPLGTSPPEKLFVPAEPGQSRQVQRQFPGVEFVGGTMLKYMGLMPTPLKDKLLALAPEDENWRRAVNELSDRSQARQPLPVPLPAALRPNLLYDQTWTPCPAPFAGIDVFQLADDQHVLGLRGVIPEALRQQLVELLPGDRNWQILVDAAAARSRSVKPGRFLGRYVQTMTTVFPYVAVFCTSDSHPSDSRDTFVVACARTPLDLSDLSEFGDWNMAPFAEYVKSAAEAPPEFRGQMAAVLELADGQILSDDFAPVDNLLRPVFVDQDR